MPKFLRFLGSTSTGRLTPTILDPFTIAGLDLNGADGLLAIFLEGLDDGPQLPGFLQALMGGGDENSRTGLKMIGESLEDFSRRLCEFRPTAVLPLINRSKEPRKCPVLLDTVLGAAKGDGDEHLTILTTRGGVRSSLSLDDFIGVLVQHGVTFVRGKILNKDGDLTDGLQTLDRVIALADGDNGLTHAYMNTHGYARIERDLEDVLALVSNRAAWVEGVNAEKDGVLGGRVWFNLDKATRIVRYDEFTTVDFGEGSDDLQVRISNDFDLDQLAPAPIVELATA